MENWLEREKFNEEFMFTRFQLMEIDECYMKWKGEPVNYSFLDSPERETGKWVLGLISRDRSKVWFYCMEDGTKNYLLDPIRDVVEPNSTILTDAYHVYDQLDNEFHHLKINKKREGFARTDEKSNIRVHVNLCENLWKNVRALAHDRHLNRPEDVPLLLIEFMFRFYQGTVMELIKVE